MTIPLGWLVRLVGGVHYPGGGGGTKVIIDHKKIQIANCVFEQESFTDVLWIVSTESVHGPLTKTRPSLSGTKLPIQQS